MSEAEQYRKVLRSDLLTCYDCLHFRALGCEPDDKGQHRECERFKLFDKNKFFGGIKNE